MPDDSRLDSSGKRVPRHRSFGRWPRTRSDLIQIDWHSYASLKFEPPSWLIKGLIPANSLIMLYGRRGQGKTFFALDIAASIASGRDCLGHSIRAKGKVCYLLAERPEGVKRRLCGWLEHTSRKTGQTVKADEIRDVFVTGVESAAIDTDLGRDYIVETVKRQLNVETPRSGADAGAPESDPASQNTLRLLIVDPLAAHMTGSENDTQDMAQLVRSIRTLSKQLGCSVLLVHHEGKRNFNNMLGARGSSALEAGLDTILYMRPDEDDKNLSELQMTKQREFPESPALWLKFHPIEGKPDGHGADIDLGKFPTLGDPPRKTPGINQQKGKWHEDIKAETYRLVCEAPDDLPDKPGVLRSTIERQLIEWGRDQGISEKFISGHIYACLNELRKAGKVSVNAKNGRGGGHLYVPVTRT